jgi:hypothetical protein
VATAAGQSDDRKHRMVNEHRRTPRKIPGGWPGMAFA